MISLMMMTRTVVMMKMVMIGDGHDANRLVAVDVVPTGHCRCGHTHTSHHSHTYTHTQVTAGTHTIHTKVT